MQNALVALVLWLYLFFFVVCVAFIVQLIRDKMWEMVFIVSFLTSFLYVFVPLKFMLDTGVIG